jgi:hypothetical protein
MLFLTVCGDINDCGELLNLDLEALLDLVEGLEVFLATHEGDGEALGAEAASATHSVEVGVGVLGHVVVEDHVDSLDIDAATKDISGDEDAVLEVLEIGVALNALLLREAAMDGDRREVVLAEHLVEGHCALNGVNEDDDLVELQSVQEVGELHDLLLLVKLDVVLLETVEGEFALVVDEDLERVAHELAADVLDVVGHGGREHHHLLLGGCGLEDLLDVGSHI